MENEKEVQVGKEVQIWLNELIIPYLKFNQKQNTDDTDWADNLSWKIRVNQHNPCYLRSKKLNTDDTDLADNRR